MEIVILIAAYLIIGVFVIKFLFKVSHKIPYEYRLDGEDLFFEFILWPFTIIAVLYGFLAEWWEED